MTRPGTLPNPDLIWPEEREPSPRFNLIGHLRPIPTVPLVTEEVIMVGQSDEARLAREHLASLSDERRAELEREWGARIGEVEKR